MANPDANALAARVAEAVKGYVTRALQPINTRLAAAEVNAERLSALEERIATLEATARQSK